MLTIKFGKCRMKIYSTFAEYFRGTCKTRKLAEYSDNISVKSLIRYEDETQKNVEASAEHVFSS